MLLTLAACGGDSGPGQSALPEADVSAKPSSPVPSEASATPKPEQTKPVPSALEHIFPVQPPSVSDYNPGHHDYPATDIFCPVGSRFVAVTAGKVDFVSRTDPWDPGVDDPSTRGGLSVAIVGDDGVRYYGSHLSEVAEGIEPGVRVRAGELLGLTGDSGNAAGTSPHLHFGVSHPTFPRDWAVRRGEIDTFPLLQAWAAGGNVTPDI